MRPPFSEKLVQRVNELYHDLTAEQYTAQHPDIFEAEGERWDRIASVHIGPQRPCTLLDIGTGSGFVPLSLARTLGREDTVICTDISKQMLESARRALKAAKAPFALEFRQIVPSAALSIPADDASVDIVTMNSVLHHILDTKRILEEIDRVLRPGGLVIIGHEPNRRYYRSRAMRLINMLRDPRMQVYDALRNSWIERPLKSLYYRIRPASDEMREHLRVTEEINRTLLEEGLITEELAHEQVKEITDIRAGEGFIPEQLFPTYDIRELEIYNHFGRDSPRMLTRLVRRAFPAQGATFTLVARKSRA